jgi:hypothetical protein
VDPAKDAGPIASVRLSVENWEWDKAQRAPNMPLKRYTRPRISAHRAGARSRRG